MNRVNRVNRVIRYKDKRMEDRTMTSEEAMAELKPRMERLSRREGSTNAMVRAAMALAIIEGADLVTVRDMAMAVGLHRVKG